VPIDTKLSYAFKLASVVILMAERDVLSRYTWRRNPKVLIVILEMV
jgi:hypothetical protein